MTVWDINNIVYILEYANFEKIYFFWLGILWMCHLKSMHIKICMKASKTMELIDIHMRNHTTNYNIILLVCANVYVCSSVKPTLLYYSHTGYISVYMVTTVANI